MVFSVNIYIMCPLGLNNICVNSNICSCNNTRQKLYCFDIMLYQLRLLDCVYMLYILNWIQFKDGRNVAVEYRLTAPFSISMIVRSLSSLSYMCFSSLFCLYIMSKFLTHCEGEQGSCSAETRTSGYGCWALRYEINLDTID